MQPNRFIETKKQGRSRWRLIFWVIVAAFLVFLGTIFVKAYNYGSKVFVSHTSFASKLKAVLFSGPSSLQGEADNRINILLLGYGGPGHDGPYLTDSMILATIDPADKKIVLTSIPRDLYWATGQQKINYAYAIGFAKHNDPNEGGQEAEQAVSELSGENVPYFASIDFSGFVKAVDQVGGLDIQVDNTFTDSQYPDSNNGYLPPITFTAGREHMDGTRALEFARSRHGNNGEDSDFARSKRQEKILSAFKEKIQQMGLLDKTSELNSLISILADHAHTNIEPNQVLHLASILKNGTWQITSHSLDLSTNLICENANSPIGYILQPCPGVNQQQINDFFTAAFSPVKNEAASVILENAGASQDYYNSTLAQLTVEGMTVYQVNYKGLPLTQTALYKINDKPATISYLEKLLNVQAMPKPAQMTAKTDMVIFLTNP